MPPDRDHRYGECGSAKQTVKQVLQHLRSGRIEVAEVPCPLVRPGHLLIQTTRSLISPGTERTLIEFGQAGLIGKARAQPEKVRQVLDKVRTDGLVPTLETVFSRLDEPLPLGYCNVGRVVELGRGAGGFRIGQRVVSNGPHAEMVLVPTTLAAPVPDAVDDETAAFTVLGAVALHGVRLAEPTFGESFAVIGLGVIGLLAVQLLRGHGCQVVGIDTNADRCALAATFGCRSLVVKDGVDPVDAAVAFAGGRGVDGVLITASATTDEIIHQAAVMCRRRGRIVLVGVVGLNLRRGDFYEKELTFQVSCSYGPGRYDPDYEGRAHDYPLPYVRWSVARNFEAVLGAMLRGTVNVRSLVSLWIPHERAGEAYRTLVDDHSSLGVILTYPDDAPPIAHTVALRTTRSAPSIPVEPVVGVIGAGNFARLVLLPAIKAAGARVHSIASAGGVTGLHAGRKFDAERTTTDYREVLQSSEVNVVFIATRHSDHPHIAAEALEAGKHVFVEKPLAIDDDGLAQVEQAYAARPDLQLMVGFNRRFAPHTVKVKQLLAGRTQPLVARMVVNAGKIAGDHWIHDRDIGGGRVIGEGCHFLDLLMFVVGYPVTAVQAVAMASSGRDVPDDTLSVNLTFADGSIGNLQYLAIGPKSYPKEHLEVFTEGRVVAIENWRRLRAYNWHGVPTMRIRQDKGHQEEVRCFLHRVTQGGPPLIPFEQLDLVTRATLAVVRSAMEGTTLHLNRALDSAADAVPPDAVVV